jgi:hypothetical protein
MAHDISNFLDSVKESLTDAQYKEGMDLCQIVFNETEVKHKLYNMTYLRPYMFMDDHCNDEECSDMKFYLTFEKHTGLVKLSDERVKRIKETNLFLGTEEEMKSFINIDAFHSFPCSQLELDQEMTWHEFPVISLELFG